MSLRKRMLSLMKEDTLSLQKISSYDDDDDDVNKPLVIVNDNDTIGDILDKANILLTRSGQGHKMDTLVEEVNNCKTIEEVIGKISEYVVLLRM